MKCPNCGGEMTAGFLQADSTADILWTQKLAPSILNLWKQETEIVSYDTGAMTNAVPAHICKRCRIFVGDYSKAP